MQKQYEICLRVMIRLESRNRIEWLKKSPKANENAFTFCWCANLWSAAHVLVYYIHQIIGCLSPLSLICLSTT